MTNIFSFQKNSLQLFGFYQISMCVSEDTLQYIEFTTGDKEGLKYKFLRFAVFGPWDRNGKVRLIARLGGRLDLSLPFFHRALAPQSN
jgi:hypothetical protein